MKLIQTNGVPESLARVEQPQASPVRVALVQHEWVEDAAALAATLRDGIRTAAEAGASIVFLPELTLSRYPADTLPEGTPSATAEDLETGPTVTFARAAARDFGVHVHASLYERAEQGDGLGFNTAVLLAPSGEVVARTRKTHIPVTAGYYEDQYFRPGPADDAYPVVTLDDPGLRLGLPTCWDEWFPEVARLYSPRAAPRCSATRPRSAPSPTTPTSTPSRSGSRSSSATASPTASSWWCPTASAPRASSPSTAAPSSPTPTAASSSRRRATRPPSSSPTSTSRSAATGSSCSRSSRPDVPTRMPP